MVSLPRKKVVNPSEITYYHCNNCFSIQAFRLRDPDGGRQRLEWFRSTLETLAQLFGIEICFHSIYWNQFNLILRSRPDMVAQLTDEEVVRRWLTITKIKRNGTTEVEPPSRERMEAEMQKAGRIGTLRKRLSHVSWFMGTLGESLSRRINRADQTKGTVWERRYQALPISTEEALLLCALYIDLNQVRLGHVRSLHEPHYSSAYARRQLQLARQAVRPQDTNATTAHDGWLAEFECHAPAGHGEFHLRSASGRRATDQGLFDWLTTDDYLRLLDWTAQQMGKPSPEPIPEVLTPIVQRLRVDERQLCEAVLFPSRELVGFQLAAEARRGSSFCLSTSG